MCIGVREQTVALCVNFQLEITLLLTAPRRPRSITVINKDRPVCQEAPASLRVRWQWQRRLLIEDGILPPAAPSETVSAFNPVMQLPLAIAQRIKAR